MKCYGAFSSLRIQPFLLAPRREGRLGKRPSGEKQGETALFAGYAFTGMNDKMKKNTGTICYAFQQTVSQFLSGRGRATRYKAANF